MQSLITVFVHGWSVSNVNTYGELPIRLKNEARILGLNLEIKEIFLGKYISFHDEVRIEDISRAFASAIKDHSLHNKNFICITHSTGGPVIRDWWHRFYPKNDGSCPMSHLIMLAPANYGSALAQLGKARIGRLKAWFDGVEPGQGVLDWLELGSSPAWNLNKDWIIGKGKKITDKGPFPFVITGQSIDRKLYDHLNTYTGEMGSDGVVRAAAANLAGRCIKLKQVAPKLNAAKKFIADDLEIEEYAEAPATPFKLVSGKSHSDKKMGIMNSILADTNDQKSAEVVKGILDCIQVTSKAAYQSLVSEFNAQTAQVQKDELVEYEDRLLKDRYFIHDRYAMVIFKVIDTEGYPVKDFDLIITAGKKSDPNSLPTGFFQDRQRNRINGETITYYLNYDIIRGTDEIVQHGKTIRAKIKGIDTLGIEITPRPGAGFVHYLPCSIQASNELLEKALAPNSTTLIEICLQRVVYKEIFQIDPLKGDKMPGHRDGDFKNVKPGNLTN